MLTIGRDPRAIFLGQAVACRGTGMSATFDGVRPEKLLELPVFENTQMGMSIGLALDGWLPISVYPRWNFLLLAADQLVNHLDKIPLYSRYRPKVIVRTASATPIPLDPGPQHLGDFSDAFAKMLQTVEIVRLDDGRKIIHEYTRAARVPHSVILVEYPERYAETL